MKARLPGYSAAILLVAMLSACGSRAPQQRTPSANNNLAYLYGQEAAALEFNARIYHGPDQASVIHFMLRTHDLLYKSDGGGAPYRAVVRITYEALSDWTGKTLIDSASTLVKDVSEEPAEDRELIGQLEMRRNEQRSFVIRITAEDLNRGTRSTRLIAVDKAVANVRQNFLPIEADRDLPIFDDHLSGPGQLRVRCEQYTDRTLLGAYYQQEFGLPAPVFAEQGPVTVDTSPDSTFTVQVGPDGLFALNLRQRGFYHFRPDTSTQAGFTLFVLGTDHPRVRAAAEMVPPLRYITSMQEYERMLSDTSVRKAVERFWLDAAGSKDRARSAIRAYYERVENANRYFTSFVEGWRTDRGLVHIIFGTPNTIHKTAQGEAWIYGEETNLMSLTFRFKQRDLPFTDNDLQLERDPMLKGAWYRNVESWRNGRIVQN